MSNSGGLKFDTHIGKKQRIAPRELPATFLKELEHKKQSMTQVNRKFEK
jgi:hypothetical protein